MLSPFEALIRSLLEQCVDYIRRDVDLQALRVDGDSISMTANVDIFLSDLAWANQEKVIDAMIEVREMFLDEVSIDYAIRPVEEWVATGDRVDQATYVAA